MKAFSLLSVLKWSCLLTTTAMVSCKGNRPELSAAEQQTVKDSVTQLTANICKDISTKGPAAWINYFEDSAGFFMASDGTLAFKDYPTAKARTVGTGVKSFKKINLTLQNLKVDPLTADYAAFGADFHEDIVFANGRSMSIGGYLTATAHFDGARWKIRNMNWAANLPEVPAK